MSIVPNYIKRKRSVPDYRQLEANDCGPTCIQMIAAYYGKRYPLKTLKQHCARYSSELEKDKVILKRFYNNIVNKLQNKGNNTIIQEY